MQLEALKVFCDIARFRSFSQAASAHDLTQSAASQIVHQLEKHLGDVQLIDRSTRPLRLTPLGQLYFDGCKMLVEQYEELEASIRRTHAQRTSSIEVAAIYSVGLGDMGQLIDRFKTQYASASVHIDYVHPESVYEKVLGRTAELGLVSFPRKQRELSILPWRDEPMVLACAPDHPLAGLHPSDRPNWKAYLTSRSRRICRSAAASISSCTASRDGGRRIGVRHHREHQAGHRGRPRRRACCRSRRFARKCGPVRWSLGPWKAVVSCGPSASFIAASRD